MIINHTGFCVFPDKYKNVLLSRTHAKFINSESDTKTISIGELEIIGDNSQNSNNGELNEAHRIIDELVDIACSNGVDVEVINGRVRFHGSDNRRETHHTETIIREDDGMGFVGGLLIGSMLF